MTLDTHVEMQLVEAREFAEKGYDIWMEKNLLEAQAYAQILGKDISGQVAEIQKLGYTTVVDKHLKAARHYAKEWDPKENWDPGIMEVCLKMAEENTQKVEYDISGQVVDIERVAYTKGLSFKLEAARAIAEAGKESDQVRYRLSPPNLAEAGNAPDMEQYIVSAQRYAQKLGEDISGQVSGIRALITQQ